MLAGSQPFHGNSDRQQPIVLGEPANKANMATSELAVDRITFRDASSNVLASFLAELSKLTLSSQGGDVTISGVKAPSADSDAATKAYVDSVKEGLDLKDSVRVVTTANGVLATAFAAGQTVDGVLLALGDRILLKEQTTASENGIYVVTAGAPTRSADLAVGASAAGVYVFSEEGTTNADRGFVCITDGGSDVVGTDSLSWTIFSHHQISAGTNLVKSGDTISFPGTVDSTLLLASGSLTDTTGAISFDDENLSTSGTLASGNLAVTGTAAVSSTATIGSTLQLATGAITDSSGAISFDNENLSTSGTLASGNLAVTGTAAVSSTATVGSTLQLATGAITDSSGAISFDNENLSTSGTLASGNLAVTGTAAVSSTATVGSTLQLATGAITDSSGAISFDDENLSTSGTLASGNLAVTGTAAVSSTATVGSTLQLATGAITDSSGAISFDDENLSTSGTLASGNLAVTGTAAVSATATVGSTLQLATGAITDSSGAISFDNENLSTTGTLASGNLTVTGTAAVSSNATINGNLTMPSTSAITVGNTQLDSGCLQDSTGSISLDGTGLAEAASFATNTVGGAKLTLAPGSITDVSGLINFGDEDLTTTGSLTCANVITSSDERLKKDIVPIADACSKVASLRGVNFSWTTTDKADVGVIAQEVQAVVPEAVSVQSSGYLGVDYQRLVPVLIQCINELSAENAQIRARLDAA